MSQYPFVEEEFETMRTILYYRCSIARYGDGELRLATGNGCKGQIFNSYLSKRLRKILKSDLDNLLIGIFKGK